MVVAFGGGISAEANSLNSIVDSYFSIIKEPPTLEEAMSCEVAKENLRSLSEQVIRLIKAVRRS